MHLKEWNISGHFQKDFHFIEVLQVLSIDILYASKYRVHTAHFDIFKFPINV